MTFHTKDDVSSNRAEQMSEANREVTERKAFEKRKRGTKDEPQKNESNDEVTIYAPIVHPSKIPKAKEGEVYVGGIQKCK